ncbi:MAG: OmpA family protein [Paludibacteraceae bacterium]|nr:OmpA family protein [Paludibacteraceae bacterium]
MKKIVLIGTALLSLSAAAQTEEYPWTVGLYGVKSEYNGDLGNNFFDVTQKFNAMGALSISRYLNKHFDASLYVAYGRYGSEDLNAQSSTLAQEFKSNMLYADLTAKYKILREEYAWRPFIYAGVGFRQLTKAGGGDNLCKDGNDIVPTVGLGCDVALSEHWGLRYTCGYGYGTSDDLDSRECGDFNDQQLLHSLGVTYSFAFKPSDKDKDGVIDKLDKCENTPEGVKVDENGCPVDSDKDGVADYLDKCPNTPEGVQVDENGCPIDSDKDGVADYLDQCADTPEGVQVDEKGCPVDSDGDGVADYLDKCPGTPAEAKGFVDANGCEIDTDGDGIADYKDACPKEAGVAENNGCPKMKEEELRTFKQAVHGIQFETGKATIKKASNPILDKIVEIMNNHPNIKLEIAGHTDNVGKPEKNQKLSEDRANAVKEYMVKKGIDAGRMTAQGFGQDKPVADNKTKAGKAENRRVEFNIVYQKLVTKE